MAVSRVTASGGSGRASSSGGRRGAGHAGATASLAALGLLLTCGWSGAGPGCEVLRQPSALSPELKETSGVAVSTAHPGIFWTHNDGSRPVLHALDEAGQTVGRVRIPGVEVWDLEDIERADCDAGSCLYVADTGDNDEERNRSVIYRIPEPDPGAGRSAVPDAFPVVFPDGPRDVEALFVLPGERAYLVSKGRHSPVVVYAYPGPLRPGAPAELVEVMRLSESPVSLPRMVTGASAAADGSVVVIRTYEALRFYRAETVEGEGADLRLVPLDDGTVNLHTLQEPQGEGVGLGADGLVVLTSEDGPGGRAPQMAVMRCRVGG